MIQMASEGRLTDEDKSVPGRYVCSRKLRNAPFTILFEKPENVLMEPLAQFNRLMILGMLLILITAIVTEILIVRKLSKPLTELNRSIKTISLEHFRMDIAGYESSDELLQIKNAFNAVMSRMKESVEQQYAAETNELKSHLFALQSQMNPHFSIIYWRLSPWNHRQTAIRRWKISVRGSAKCCVLPHRWKMDSVRWNGKLKMRSIIWN